MIKPRISGERALGWVSPKLITVRLPYLSVSLASCLRVASADITPDDKHC